MRRERVGPERGHELEVVGVTRERSAVASHCWRERCASGGTGDEPASLPRPQERSSVHVQGQVPPPDGSARDRRGAAGALPLPTCPPPSDAVSLDSVSLASVGTGRSPGPPQCPAAGRAQRTLPNGPPSPQSALLSSAGAFRPQGRALGVQGRCLPLCSAEHPPPQRGAEPPARRARATHLDREWLVESPRSPQARDIHRPPDGVPGPRRGEEGGELGREQGPGLRPDRPAGGLSVAPPSHRGQGSGGQNRSLQDPRAEVTQATPTAPLPGAAAGPPLARWGNSQPSPTSGHAPTGGTSPATPEPRPLWRYAPPRAAKPRTAQDGAGGVWEPRGCVASRRAPSPPSCRPPGGGDRRPAAASPLGPGLPPALLGVVWSEQAGPNPLPAADFVKPEQRPGVPVRTERAARRDGRHLA